ncbi:multimerin-1-like [Anguilla rostrata]|uniref:multimerin-1-like n=1 Tax=Anguilla rostrata TaxID=7938 RepID=UPI0030D2AA21
MTWMWLTYLYFLYFSHKSLGMITYNRTAGQLENHTISPNLTVNNSEENSQEAQQRNLTASRDELQTTKSTASVARILYVTNNTAGFSKNNQIAGRRNSSTPVIQSQRIRSGFGLNEKAHKPPGLTFSSRSATKPSFETSRGKSWCAYVHTRLTPTVVMDSASSYVPIVTDPCYWSREGCQRRYQMMSSPTYKIKHKIMTSLEWRCCPGYVGPQCQPKDSSPQIQQPARRAEVHSDSRTSEVPAPEGSEQATEPAIKPKMDNEVMNQASKLTSLLNKVNDISTDMDNMKKVLSSLEEKLNEEKGDDLPSILRALKTKAIQEFFRDIVQKEIKPFQSMIQESISNIIKNQLSVSEDIEATKVSLKQFNKTVITLAASQSPMKASNTHMGNDIQNLKDQVSSLQEDISVIQTNITTELKDEYSFQKDNVALEGEPVYGSAIPDRKGNENSTLSEQVSLLGDAVRKQALLTLQLQQDLHEQGLAVWNLSNAAGLQSRPVGETSDTLVERCKQDLRQQMQEIKDSIRTVNQTLCDKVNPMDDMMNAIEEKISHVSYDLEELRPIKDNNGFAGVFNEEKQTAELSAMKGQLESLATTINILNISITGLEKAQEELSNQTKAKEDEVDKKLRGCQDGIEDALNDTMTIINKAIDAVKDNHYILENNLDNTNRQLNEIYDDVTKKINNSNLIPYIDFLNSTVLILQQKMERFDDLSLFDRLSDSMNQTNEMNKPENLTHLSQQLTEALSKLEDHQTTIEHLQGSHANYSSNFREHRMHLQRMESRINSLNYNSTPTIKPKKKLPAEMGLAWKYKYLNNRVEDLAIIMFNLTTEVLWLKESDQNVRNLYQNVSILLDRQAHIPQIFEEHINFTHLQKGLNELLKQEGQDLCESVPMNPTAYLNCVLASMFKDISVLQRHAEDLDERLEATATLNASSAVSGRSQRNTDNIVNQVESQGCAHYPCQNGGTCIDAQHGYVCACRSPFGGTNCTVKLSDSAASPDFSKGSYRYAPMVTFFVAHTYTMSAPGPIRFNNLYVNYGVSYAPGTGKFSIPYLGVYVFKYTIEYTSSAVSGYLVVDDVDKLAFRSQDSRGQDSGSRVITGDAVLELNFGQQVWLRLDTGSIPARYPPVTTFGGYLLYRT